MSWISRIRDVFSNRNDTSSINLHHIPETFRHRVLHWCMEVFSNRRTGYGSGDYTSNFIVDIHNMLQYRFGRSVLAVSDTVHNITQKDDLFFFLKDCRGEEFLDFIEYIFRIDCFFRVELPEDQLIEELNELFEHDNLPYFLTNFVKETAQEYIDCPPYDGRKKNVIKTVEYPKVIMKESEAIHLHAIEPTLKFLMHPDLKNANSEFLEALEDYRKGDYDDCLTKCGSSFESVMKIICEKRGWEYNQPDTARTLIKIILDNTQLENYFEPVLTIIATLRNRLSSAHGTGSANINVPRHLVTYTINATASAILLIVHETGMQ